MLLAPLSIASLPPHTQSAPRDGPKACSRKISPCALAGACRVADLSHPARTLPHPQPRPDPPRPPYFPLSNSAFLLSYSPCVIAPLSNAIFKSTNSCPTVGFCTLGEF